MSSRHDNVNCWCVIDVRGSGGVSDACAVCKNIAYYRMRMGIIGDQFAHRVADDLNIYFKQLPCVGTPKF